MRNVRRLAIGVALALGACAGAAAGADLILDESPAAIVGSAVPALLGPITEAGRNGWTCMPERAATARSAAAAGLPRD